MWYWGSGSSGCKNVKEQHFEVDQRQKIFVARETGEKKIRRVIFKADEWYAGASMSIGIAGRPKGSRPVAMLMPRADDGAD